jgi:hypothetical protein
MTLVGRAPATLDKYVLRQRLRIAIFAAIVFLPAVLGVARISDIAFNENRRPAEFPWSAIVALDLRGAATGLEAYVADRFALRPALIGAVSLFKFSFGVSSNSAVLIGSEGWLFSNGGTDHLDDMGIVPKDLPSIVTWKRALVERRAWVEERGSRFVFVVAPQKETIYPEHLPWWLSRRGADTKASRLIEALRGTGVDTLDLRPMLRDGRDAGQLFFRRDTHWNSLGAFLGARAIVDYLHTLMPHVPSFNQQRFTLRWREPDIRWPDSARGRGSLDQVTMLGLPWLMETDAIITPRDGWRAKLQTEYRGGHQVHYFVQDAPDLPILVFYGDSYVYPLMQLIAEHFRRAVFINIWEYYAGCRTVFPLQFILDERPDIVVNMRLERGLYEPVGNPPEVGSDCR